VTITGKDLPLVPPTGEELLRTQHVIEAVQRRNGEIELEPTIEEARRTKEQLAAIFAESNGREPDSSRFRDGKKFILEAPTEIPALWGRDREVLCAKGEATFVCGPTGVGKSTLMQQLMLKRIGIGPAELLGYPVAPAEGIVCYLAADRPSQIARSMRRMVTEEHADVLHRRLLVWSGPLPFDLVKQPEQLAEWAITAGISDLYIDSLKDIAAPLSSDEVGSAYNRAAAGVIAAGIEIVVNHHHRKATSENKRPSSLSDVYGSTWLTAGAGSVICIWGQAGDPVVELCHLKQPGEEVGPLDLEHDHDHGVTTVRERPDAWTLLQGAVAGGITARDAASYIYNTDPSRAQIAKIRRRFDKFVTDGKAVVIPGGQTGEPHLYRPVAK
jgi:replicative DNA helicase